MEDSGLNDSLDEFLQEYYHGKYGGGEASSQDMSKSNVSSTSTLISSPEIESSSTSSRRSSISSQNVDSTSISTPTLSCEKVEASPSRMVNIRAHRSSLSYEIVFEGMKSNENEIQILIKAPPRVKALEEEVKRLTMENNALRDELKLNQNQGQYPHPPKSQQVI